MKIIIEVKDTAILSSIDVLDKALRDYMVGRFSDVIKSISKEY